MLDFNDFRKLAKDQSLNTNEKVGFNDIHRKDTEVNILPDILNKLDINGGVKLLWILVVDAPSLF